MSSLGAIAHEEIPRARVLSVWRALFEFAANAVIVSVALGIGYAASQAGCRNDAITYARTVWPNATCNAIRTSWSGGDDDTAICRVDGRAYQCTVPGARTISTAGCSEVGR